MDTIGGRSFGGGEARRIGEGAGENGSGLLWGLIGLVNDDQQEKEGYTI